MYGIRFYANIATIYNFVLLHPCCITFLQFQGEGAEGQVKFCFSL